LAAHPRPWSDVDLVEYAKRFPKRLQSWLDAGHGACLLRETQAAEIVQKALSHFDGARHLLDGYAVMPNHVHGLVKPSAGHSLPSIMHAWKSFTAHAINRLLGRAGPLWQDESYDHLVRSRQQLEFYRAYIRENPANAGCKPGTARVGQGKGVVVQGRG